jgi:glycyl-tRNA synthetase beta chain
MPEFFLELFSEEIPARMQRDASIQLERICNDVLRSLHINRVETYYGPRRIAIKAEVAAKSDTKIIEERGPRDTAPEAALAGFMGKHKASKEEILIEGGYYWLRRNENPVAALEVIAAGLPSALAKFSWPKSMRWGQGDNFTWVRPLRRIVCLLDGEVIPFALGPVTASNETEGHRFLAPGAFTVSSANDWEEKLKKRFVIADQTKRRQMIADGIAEKAGELGLNVVDDPALIDEVNGLVEWPVSLIGKIDEDFMDLPPEVRELSMKVNQRYFALRDEAGKPAAHFAFVANVPGRNDVSAIVSGNERVLRARLSDARHFWDLDLKLPLSHYLEKLENITFHAKLGTQLDRANRIAELSGDIAFRLGATAEKISLAVNAGGLAKADLATGMVGEFPELQGIIGGYYAAKHPERWDGAVVSEAIRSHYLPRGPGDPVPTGTIAISVALADKLDTLTQFFAAGEKPTGSGDPYALRRAALGVVRIILENDVALHLKELKDARQDVFDFIIERLRVKLRSEGQRFDILDAVLGNRPDDDLTRIMHLVDAVHEFLVSEDGRNLLVAYRRASNILKIENAKDGPHQGADFRADLEQQREERELSEAIGALRQEFYGYGDMPAGGMLEFREFKFILENFARLRAPVDAFFDKVTVNVAEPEIRRNRLSLLAKLRDTMHQIADFSKIEG